MEGVELVAALMEQSARDLAWTNDKIHEHWREETRRYATALVGLMDVLQGADVIDRRTERRIWDFAGIAQSAQDTLRHMEENR
jgi:hypothetical protein